MQGKMQILEEEKGEVEGFIDQKLQEIEEIGDMKQKWLDDLT